jgi:hypothetical protein
LLQAYKIRCINDLSYPESLSIQPRMLRLAAIACFTFQRQVCDGEEVAATIHQAHPKKG